jgi:hypothetical protein
MRCPAHHSGIGSKFVMFCCSAGLFLALANACSPTTGSGGDGSGGNRSGSGGASPPASGTGGAIPQSGSGGAGGEATPATGGSSGLGGAGDAAGPVDTGAPGTDGGTGPGGCAGARVCEDFEAYAVGAAPGGIWQPQIQNGTLVVDEMRAISGKRALHLKGGLVSSTTLYITTKMPALPVAGNALYGRAMVFLPKVPTGDGLHWDMIRGSGKRPGGQSSQYNIGTARGGFLIDSEPNDCTRYSKTMFPQARWACLSWLFDGSPAASGGGTKNEIHLWLDGKPVEDATVARFGDQCTYMGRPEWVAPVFETFSIGWQQYHPGPEFEMWIDDVAIDDKMIPCPVAP